MFCFKHELQNMAQVLKTPCISYPRLFCLSLSVGVVDPVNRKSCKKPRYFILKWFFWIFCGFVIYWMHTNGTEMPGVSGQRVTTVRSRSIRLTDAWPPTLDRCERTSRWTQSCQM